MVRVIDDRGDEDFCLRWGMELNLVGPPTEAPPRVERWPESSIDAIIRSGGRNAETGLALLPRVPWHVFRRVCRGREDIRGPVAIVFHTERIRPDF